MGKSFFALRNKWTTLYRGVAIGGSRGLGPSFEIEICMVKNLDTSQKSKIYEKKNPDPPRGVRLPLPKISCYAPVIII